MGKVKGKKGIILDSCFSGQFVEELAGRPDKELIRDYVLIASTTKDGYSVSSDRWKLPDKHPLKSKLISPVVHWIHERSISDHVFNLTKAPFNEYILPRKDNATEQEDRDYERRDLRMQRIGDSDFIL